MHKVALKCVKFQVCFNDKCLLVYATSLPIDIFLFMLGLSLGYFQKIFFQKFFFILMVKKDAVRIKGTIKKKA